MSDCINNEGCYNEHGHCEHYPHPGKFTQSQVDLINTFRKLWEQHDVWTRSTIMSINFNLPDLDLVIDRLLRNPSDFGRVFAFFYGNEVGEEFRDLLRAHLVIAAQLVEALKAGNNQLAAELDRQWHINADQIAALLHRINPFQSEEEWRAMMYEHLRLVAAEAVDILTGNYAAGIAVYDEIEAQTLQMADMMAFGVFRNFPCRFRD